MANIVEAVKNELTGDLLEKLAASTGGNVDSVKSLANAAAPALLSALAGLASSKRGSESLSSVLKNFGDRSPDALRIDIAEGRGAEIQKRGDDILGSLLGGAGLRSLLEILAGFANSHPEMVKKFLGFLAPLIMSTIASQMKSAGGPDAADPTRFFAEQKSNINGAIPAGLSLAGLPANLQHAADAAVGAAAGPASPLYWMLPLLALAAIGFLLWNAFLNEAAQPPPTFDPGPGGAVAPAKARGARTTGTGLVDAPEPAAPPAPPAPPVAADVTKSLGDANILAIQALTPVNSVETAERQLPALTDLVAKIDSVKALWDKLAEADKQAVSKSSAENRDLFKTLADKVLAIPGVSDKLKEVVSQLVAKFGAFTV